MKRASKNQTKDYDDNTLLTLKAAGEFIGMSASFMKSIKNRNEVAFYKIGRRVMFRVSDLEKFVADCRVESEEKGSVSDV